MRVRFKRLYRVASVLALMQLGSLGCSSSSDHTGFMDEFPDQQEFADLDDEFGDLDGNAISDFNMGDNFGNFDAGDNFGGGDFGNFGGDGFDNFNDNSFGGDGFNQFDNNFGFGGEGDLENIIEEVNQSGFDQFDGTGFNNFANTTGGMDDVQLVEQESMATAGAPLAPGLPELGSKMSYIVQRGDTLAKIATRIYGDPNRWTELANFTGLANPRLIYPGDVVYYQLTEQSMAFAAAYESVTRSEVQVREGDTLSTIAGRVLGNSANWKLIWRQNDNIDNPDRLTAGTTIYYIEPMMLASAIESFKDHYAKTQSSGEVVAKNDMQETKSTKSISLQVDTIEVFTGLDVQIDQFIEAEFGSAFAQMTNKRTNHKLFS